MIKNILEYFENTVKIKSNKIAVVDGDRKIVFVSIRRSSRLPTVRVPDRCSKLLPKICTT